MRRVHPAAHTVHSYISSLPQRQLLQPRFRPSEKATTTSKSEHRGLPNKMTLAVSSSLIRWALWASRHLHTSRMEGQASSGLLFSSTDPTFLLFMWKQMTDSHSGVIPGQWKTLCGYSNLETNNRARGFTVHTVQWYRVLVFDQSICINKYFYRRKRKFLAL